MSDSKKPAWLNDEPAAPSSRIVRAGIMDEPAPSDQWRVTGKDPDFHYVWANMDDDRELSMLASRGYVPASGAERILGNPFEHSDDKPGKSKVRGRRILMKCPMKDYLARQQVQASRQVSAKKAAESDARRMMAEHKGAFVKADAESETKREKLEE
jgi:hypothetical protein